MKPEFGFDSWPNLQPCLEDHYRICKWFMVPFVNKSPNWGYFPTKWPERLVNRGDPNHLLGFGAKSTSTPKPPPPQNSFHFISGLLPNDGHPCNNIHHPGVWETQVSVGPYLCGQKMVLYTYVYIYIRECYDVILNSYFPPYKRYIWASIPCFLFLPFWGTPKDMDLRNAYV